MLKIKQKRLEELENFGFDFGNYIFGTGYLRHDEDGDFIFVFKDNGGIYFEVNDFCGGNYAEYTESLIEDLFKADLVEKSGV